jgi:monoterpene epsilon-lactone hydrolase
MTRGSPGRVSNPAGSAASEATAIPTLRARIMNFLVRLVVKHWPRGDQRALTRNARFLFGQSAGMNFAVSFKVNYERVENTDLCGEWVIPEANEFEDKAVLYLHGGGYISCSPRTHRAITAALARSLRRRVFVPDYRLAPESPFPAAVDDAARAFTWLMEQGFTSNNIAVAGDSAGGGLVVALLLRLKSTGQPQPACAACLSPWVDLTGEWNYGNGDSCSMFWPSDIGAFAMLYLNGASPRLPEASPVFADLKGLPPLLIQASNSELLYDEAVRLHEKAQRSGVESTLRVYAGLPHVWQMFAFLIPEAGIAMREIAGFIEAKTKE